MQLIIRDLIYRSPRKKFRVFPEIVKFISIELRLIIMRYISDELYRGIAVFKYFKLNHAFVISL